MKNVIVREHHTKDGIRVWPDCDLSRAYARNLGTVALPNDYQVRFNEKDYTITVRYTFEKD